MKKVESHTHTWVWKTVWKICGKCEGHEYILVGEKTVDCNKCGGKGVVKHQFQVCDFCGIERESPFKR